MSLQRSRVLRLMRARPRLFIAAGIAFATSVLLPTDVASQSVTRWLIAWNVGAGLYVLLAAIMMIRSSSNHMRHRAQLQDDGQLVILSLVVVATIASLAAIAGELAVVRRRSCATCALPPPAWPASWARRTAPSADSAAPSWSCR